MDESSYIRDAGRDLVEFAYQIPDELARSRSEILFPFIFVASKKMSSRAISRWLSEVKGLDFSAASVAKILRECDKYFCLIAERVQPLAEHVSAQFGGTAEELLFQDYGRDRIDARIRESYPGEDAIGYTERVLNELTEEWFLLEEEIRFRCKPFFQFEPTTTQTNDR